MHGACFFLSPPSLSINTMHILISFKHKHIHEFKAKTVLAQSSMAIPKLLVASFVLALLLVHGVEAIQANEVTSNSVTDAKIDCGSACAVRCSKSSRPRLCKRACGTCCARCSCVPPGTYGNYNVCPCYAKLTTHHNRRKCP